MTPDLSILSFFTHAGPVVKAVMILLVGLSVFSWAYIIQIGLSYRETRKQAAEFEQYFWSGIDRKQYYQQLSTDKRAQFGLMSLFLAGLREYQRLLSRQVSSQTLVEGVYGAMQAAQNRELDRLEKNLSFLATIGSISPYIGLFGTVWGIMTSFSALSVAQQASLQMVAPGISEALVATAMGLFAAIPAVIAYNRYVHQVERFVSQYERFQEELTNAIRAGTLIHPAEGS